MTAKKIIAITIGAIIDPRNNPNLYQSIFRGVNILEFLVPKNKKIKEIDIGTILICCRSPLKDHIDIMKKSKKNTKPKLRFELIFILDFCTI